MLRRLRQFAVVRRHPTDHGTSINDLGSYSTPTLSVGASDAEHTNVTVPSTPGTYYVWIVADNESPATGNQGQQHRQRLSLAGSFTVTAAAANSDLIPQSMSLGRPA
jgi:hypothetical protein